MVDLKNVTIIVDGNDASITDITVEQAQEIWDRCSGYERFDKTLKRIEKMFQKDGTVRVDTCRMKEMVRQAYHPDEPCPQCKGVGKIPSTNRDCGVCKGYDSQTMGYGKCTKGKKKGLVDEGDFPCEDFDDICPMQTCPSCRGEK